MGLGKTIQGVGVAELLAREANIAKVLVVCPASLKSQWRSEVRRFSRRTALPSDDQLEALAQGFVGLLAGLAVRGSPAPKEAGTTTVVAN
jgi:hypothetical protein